MPDERKATVPYDYHSSGIAPEPPETIESIQGAAVSVDDGKWHPLETDRHGLLRVSTPDDMQAEILLYAKATALGIQKWLQLNGDEDVDLIAEVMGQ